MSTTKKTVLILLDLISLTLLISVLLDYQAAFPLHWNLLPLAQWPWLGQYMPPYLFVVAAALAVLLLLFIIVVLCYPRAKTEILLDQEMGSLTLKKSAIEGFVKEIILENDYFKNPKIRVKCYSRKIKIKASGEVIPRVQVVEKTQNLEEEIRTGLKNFFGIEQKMKLQVDIQAIQPRKTSSQARVK